MDEYNLTIVNIILKHFEEFIEYGGTVAGKREIKFAEHVNNKKCKCDNELLKTKLGETVSKSVDAISPINRRRSVFPWDSPLAHALGFSRLVCF